MKVNWFHLMPSHWMLDNFREKYHGVRVDLPNALYDPERGRRLYNEYLDILEYADQMGFDATVTNSPAARPVPSVQPTSWSVSAVISKGGGMKSERRTQQKLYWSGALLMCGIIFAAAYSARKADALAGIPDPASRNPAGASRISTAFGSLPLCFIENQGQVDARVAYYVQGRDRSAFFSSRGITFTLTSPPEPAAPETAGGNEKAEENQEDLTALTSKHLAGAFRLPGGSGRPSRGSESGRRHKLSLDFVGASQNVRPVGQDELPTVVSYFSGPREQWKTELKTYGGILYPNLWPGIDLVYTGTDDRLKYIFLVRPGADPEQIRLAWRGATGVQVSEAGELEVSTPAGVFRDEKPYVYQEVSGKGMTLLSPPPLRTVRASLPAHGSSLSERPTEGTRYFNSGRQLVGLRVQLFVTGWMHQLQIGH